MGPNEKNNKIGMNIRRIRKEKRITKQKICKALEIDQDRLFDIEEGWEKITINTVVCFSKVLRCNPMDLI